ncbi:MAG: cytochrome c oxidase subunit II [Actinobacteria bacterium QS_5_72_10]|nr:MAG: cytochrome c oxidase subunit II [Actinobacteria bacterium QS_5_72_10]
MAGHRKAILARTVVIGALALGLAACGRTEMSEYPLDALSPNGPIAEELDRLWQIVFPIAVGVFVLVEGLILIAVLKFRDRGDGDLPHQVEGNTRLEILWTIIPAVILAGIAVPTVGTIFELSEAPAKEERVEVEVVGKQFFWQFEYVNEGFFTANEMVVPTDTPVYLHLEGDPVYKGPDGREIQEASDLVLHSFWVPRLAGKTDFVPGADRYMTLEASQEGTYLGNCAEFCGLSHANMRIRVRAVSQQEYEEWVAQQAKPAASPPEGPAARGEEIFGANCVTCHAVKGHPDNVGQRTGPDLTHFNSRTRFAGAIFDVDDTQQLRAWIRNPPAEKPGAQMPPFGPDQISEGELDALIQYLHTLD